MYRFTDDKDVVKLRIGASHNIEILNIVNE